ncbi:hypothetical protein L7F22_044539 [Adiantum nelumboides]|nr:hypothetical protein [Adiantum nelumboides]
MIRPSDSSGDLNRLVMDYLVIEGYKNAAQRFSVETGMSPQVDLESIENRMIIRSAIQRGDVEDAIGRVNELDPEILDTNPLLFFHLQQQRLIELIRSNNINEALHFAAEELAPRAEEHPDLLPELERTMALLAFDIPSSPPLPQQPVRHQMAPRQARRRMLPSKLRPVSSSSSHPPALKTAGELNAAILTSQSQGKEPKLPQLVRLLVYGEGLLSEEKMNFPRLDLAGSLELGKAPAAMTATTMTTTRDDEAF